MQVPLNSAPTHSSAFPAAFPWQAGFADLGEFVGVATEATPLPAPYWVARNPALARQIGMTEGALLDPQWLQAFSGNRPLAGARSVATVYSGHQFGVWAGQLGDGRALLLGDWDGQEMQLKGAGLTPYSRMGDGRAVLRSSIREYLASEAMHALGIPTTRALCVTGSDAPVVRERVETAAVVTRLAPSFVRFGHFEHFCHHGMPDELRALADFVIARYYPQCRSSSALEGNAYANFLQAVTVRTAELLAAWQAVGFCHGVMNTDNMSILGLTIDYGPFQFLDAYDPGHICNHSDAQGRYAFDRQPTVAHWNLFCLGQALLPLIGQQELALAALEHFKPVYTQAYALRMANKLGLTQSSPDTMEFVRDLLACLAAQRVDYTIFWHRLSLWAQQRKAQDSSVRDLFVQPEDADALLQRLTGLWARAPLATDTGLMLRTNPQFVLRNYLCETAIAAAREKDFSAVQELFSVITTPFDTHDNHAAWAGFPPDWAAGLSLSCSS